MAAAEEVGRQMIGGRNAQTMGSVKAGVKVDVSRISSVTSAFKSLLKTLKDVRSELTGIGKASSNALPGSGPVSSGYLPKTTNSSAPRSAGGSFLPGILGGRPGGPPGVAPPGGVTGYLSGTGWGGIAAGVGQGVGSMVGAVDNRVNANMAYALPADRLSVVQQQMTGLSQNQVANQYRKPLANYRLGQGGVNSLLTNQTRYGIDAGKQAAGYEALRTVSGYSVGTQDLVNMQNQLTSPQVANRLFNMTGGFNFNKAGGGAADLFSSFQRLSKIQGLDNPNILKGAFQQGSFTRANLSNLGIDSSTQDLLLQYAQENQTFKKKGGKGDYDPSKKADRKLMGIESNYATQNEETDRLKVQRDENMYRRQADNYASLEKSNQGLIKALGSLEDKLSGLIGARTSSRPWQKAAGGLLGAVGAGLLFTPLAPLGAVAIGAGAALGGAGDPTPQAGGVKAASVGGSASDANDSNIAIPVGYGNQKASLSQIKNRADFKSMKPIMQDRLLRMFRANPNVGIVNGFRSSADQEKLFRSRYRPTNKNTGITWMGQNWEHVSGAPAAPPGKSMHEIGLAADLVGDTSWVSANASRFGLKNFANVNGEKWHVQPSELPNSRTEYEKSSGKPVDTSATFGAADAAASGATSSGSGSSGGYSGPTSSGPNAYTGFSIQDVLNTVLGQRPMGSGASSARSSKPSNSANPTATTSGGTPSSIAPSGTLAGEQVARDAWNAGFRGQDLVNIVAIAKRESRWKPTAFNGNKKTGDESYGLTQINMLGNMGPARRKQFGITSNEQLFDPQTNMNAAFKLYQGSGNKLTPWGGYNGKSNTFNTDIAGAQQAVTNAHLGDPMPQGPVDFGVSRGPASRTNSMPSNVQVHSSPQITMPVTFEFNGVPSTIDMKDIASKLMAMIKTEAELEGMRIS